MTLCPRCHEADPHHPHEDCGDKACQCACRPKRVVTLRMTEEEYAELRVLAAREHRSMNSQLLHLVAAACEQDPSTEPAPRQPAASPVLAPRSQTLALVEAAPSSLEMPPYSPPKGTPPKDRKKPATRLPDGWQPNEHHRAFAFADGVDLDREAENFRDYCASKDVRYVDHDRAFSKWLRSGYRARPGPNGHRDHMRMTPSGDLVPM